MDKNDEKPVAAVSSDPSVLTEDLDPTSTFDSPTESLSESTWARNAAHAGGTTSPFSTLTVETAPFTEAISPTASNVTDPVDGVVNNADDVTTAGLDEALNTEDSSVSISVTEEVADELGSGDAAAGTLVSIDKTISSDKTESASAASTVKNGHYYYKVNINLRADFY